MKNHDEAASVRPLTLAWVGRHLEAGERIVKAEELHGGITAEMRQPPGGALDRSAYSEVRSEMGAVGAVRVEGALSRAPQDHVLTPQPPGGDPAGLHLAGEAHVEPSVRNGQGAGSRRTGRARPWSQCDNTSPDWPDRPADNPTSGTRVPPGVRTGRAVDARLPGR
jgi:hypothetical protein